MLPGSGVVAAPTSRTRPLTAGSWSVSALLGGVALVARLAYWWSTAGNPLRSDAGQYHELATNLAHGEGFAHQFPQLALHPTAFRPPVLPGVLAAVYRVTGAHQGVAEASRSSWAWPSPPSTS